MATSAELMQQANALAHQAAELRKTEVATKVTEIKAIMADNGITPEDLGFVSPKKKRVKAVPVNNTPATGASNDAAAAAAA
jgi:DNA-binding protein H-NS